MRIILADMSWQGIAAKLRGGYLRPTNRPSIHPTYPARVGALKEEKKRIHTQRSDHVSLKSIQN